MLKNKLFYRATVFYCILFVTYNLLMLFEVLPEYKPLNIFLTLILVIISIVTYVNRPKKNR